MTVPRVSLVLAMFSAVLLGGCGSTPPPSTSTQSQSVNPAASQAEQKAVVLYTAKKCFTNMSALAQRWQADAMPFHMESELNSEATGQDGKATVWRALFASRTRGSMMAFTCSGSVLPAAPPYGITSAAETPYSANIPSLMFDKAYLQQDSDAAFAATLKHGGDAFVKKDPKQPVLYLLDWDSKQKKLVWTIIYGKSTTSRQGVCVIDAASGAFLRAGK